MGEPVKLASILAGIAFVIFAAGMAWAAERYDARRCRQDDEE